ncbi:MAG: hypothetical protein GY729_19285 [Desulfobacteraceae bacterium]|nr:hypothetical protein [Desulfobacteraceae bacterium]
MFDPGTFLGDLIKTIAGNKLYLVITTAICTALVIPLIRYIVKNIWEGLNRLFTKLSRSRKFFEDYISWTIHTNKYISVLPTTMAAVKTGTLHLMELDEIYISLTMTRGADAGRSLFLEDIIRKNNRIIILGDPGKSTLKGHFWG